MNFMSADDLDRVRVNYGENYARLVEIKSKDDPTNLFQMNRKYCSTTRFRSRCPNV